MVLAVGDIIQLLTTLSREEDIRVSVKESLKGGAIAGSAACVGGVVAGPPGVAVGAAIGGLLGYYATKGKFKSAVEIFGEMTEKQQQEIYDKAVHILRQFDATDALNITAAVAGDQLLRQQMINVIREYLQGDMGLHVLD